MASISGVKGGINKINKAYSTPIKKLAKEILENSKGQGGWLWKAEQNRKLTPYATGRRKLNIGEVTDRGLAFKKSIISMGELKQANLEQMGKLHLMNAEKLVALYKANSEIFDYYFDYEEFLDTPMGMMTVKESFDEVETLIRAYERVYGAI